VLQKNNKKLLAMAPGFMIQWTKRGFLRIPFGQPLVRASDDQCYGLDYTRTRGTGKPLWNTPAVRSRIPEMVAVDHWYGYNPSILNEQRNRK